MRSSFILFRGTFVFYLLTLFASSGFAQDGLQPTTQSAGVDEKLITAIHQTAERLLGANRFVVNSSEVTTASDQSVKVSLHDVAGRFVRDLFEGEL